jgi:hypothetical protein
VGKLGASSSFLAKLEDERPTFRVELGFDLADGKPAEVECRDLGPKQWWMIPDGKGLPVIVKKMEHMDDWDDVEKLKYYDYLGHVCRLSISKVRDVVSEGDNHTDRWLDVEFVLDSSQAGVFGNVLKMTLEQFDSGDNVARVGQRVLFFRELRRADAGPVRRGTKSRGTDSVRKSGGRKRATAA